MSHLEALGISNGSHKATGKVREDTTIVFVHEPHYAQSFTLPDSQQRELASRRRVFRILGLVIGSLLSVGIAFFEPLIASILAALVFLSSFTVTRNKAGALVGFYWLLFVVKSVALSQITIPLLFYPFYISFGILIMLALFRRGVVLEPTFMWLLLAYTSIILISLFGVTGPSNATVAQALIVVLIAPVVLTILTTYGQHMTVIGYAILSSSLVGGWIVYSAATTDFQYRAGVEVNQNTAAFMIGVGLLITIVNAVNNLAKDSRCRWKGVGLLFLAMISSYGFLLLASRGMTISFGIALASLFVYLLRENPRKLLAAFLSLAIAALGLLLPGGSGLLDRFQTETVETAGDRAPIWDATLIAFKEGTLFDITLGAGFGRSKEVVQAATGTQTSTHSGFLLVVFDYGLLGLTVYLLIHALGLALGYLANNEYGLLSNTVLWFLLASNISSTSNEGFMYWLALGVALALATESRSRASSGQRKIITRG